MEKGKRNLIVFLVILTAVTAGLAVLFWPFIKNLDTADYRDRFSRWIEGLGWKGALVFLGIQVLQVVVAVIPGEPVELLAGAAYGPLWGLLFCLAGSAAGSALIFCLVRRFGAPLTDKFCGAAQTSRFAFLQNARKTSLVVFFLFLAPGTPKDALTYLVPLSKMSLRRFLLLSSAARIPSVLSSTILGSSVIQDNWKLSALIFAAILLMGLAGILFSDRIVNGLKSARF